jgi:OOP family OmpA-OmpF porin
MRHALLAMISLFVLAACEDGTTSLKQLRHAPPSENPYQAALATRYQDFAEERVSAYDWYVAKYFADKGLMAAYGQETLPEDPLLWKIPADAREAITIERKELLKKIADAKTSQPAQSAQAVVAFDRWLVAVDRTWDQEAIDAAHSDYIAAVALIDKPPVTDVSEAAPIPTPIEPTSVLIYFPFDSPNLTGTARAAVKELASYLSTAGRTRIMVNGHADRAGPEDYNMTLSQYRAEMVVRTLVELGVAKKAIQYFAFGESDNAVPTDDGVAEPLNRRVEIFLE